jgi:hypothetical protein
MRYDVLDSWDQYCSRVSGYATLFAIRHLTSRPLNTTPQHNIRVAYFGQRHLSYGVPLIFDVYFFTSFPFSAIQNDWGIRLHRHEH